MRNLSLTSPSTMSNSNALMSSTPSLVLRAPRSKAKAAKENSNTPVIHGKQLAKIQAARTSALNVIKLDLLKDYLTQKQLSELKDRINSETDYSKLKALEMEALKKGLLERKLLLLREDISAKQDQRRKSRVCMWLRDRNWYTARCLIMEKDAVKLGVADIKIFKNNLKNCTSSDGQIHSTTVDMDILLKYTDDLKWRLRTAGHPSYQNGKVRRKYIRKCLFNRYFATPIIP